MNLRAALQDAEVASGTGLEETLEEASNGELLLGAAFLLSFALLHRPLSRLFDRALLGGARREPPLTRPQWHPLHLALILLLYVAAQVIVALVAVESFGVDPDDPATFDALPVWAELVLAAISMGLPALVPLVVAWRARGAAERLGWRGSAPGRTSIYGALRYGTIFPVILGLGTVTMLIHRVLGLDSPQQDVAIRIQEGFAAAPVLITVLATLVVPLIEEVLFRGFLLEFLRERWGAMLAAIASSALFALLHGLSAALPIFGLALLLASIKLRTGSLVAVWLVHAIHNGVQTLLLTSGVQP